MLQYLIKIFLLLAFIALLASGCGRKSTADKFGGKIMAGQTEKPEK